MKQRINQNFGFQVPVIKDSDFFLGEGNLPRIVLEETGNWVDSLPMTEPQARGGLDSINCTAFKTLDQIEIYELKAFGERNNYSERWVGIISGTTSRGNDPAKVYDAIREYGLIPEEMLPWSDDIQSLDEYFSFKGADKEACYRAGREWKTRKDFMHNWVFRADQPLDEKLNNMKVALRYSPLAFDVSAWEKNADGKYIRFGMSGHWTTCYNIGDFIDVFNSYDPFLKQLVMNFNFFYCKRISITKKIPLTVAQKKSIWQILSAFLFGEPEELKKLEPMLNPDFMPEKQPPTPISPVVPYVPPVVPKPTNTEKLKKLCIESIGKDLSTIADNVVACAESLSVIIQGVFPDFPRFLSTIAIKSHLGLDKRFQRCEAEAWAIIVSPTVGKNIGHTGVLGENGVIYSNNSKTGLWSSHWTLDEWIKYYRTKKGLKVYFYKIV